VHPLGYGLEITDESLRQPCAHGAGAAGAPPHATKSECAKGQRASTHCESHEKPVAAAGDVEALPVEAAAG
jgi:hypothetical protein